jgi:hypothetical protein
MSGRCGRSAVRVHRPAYTLDLWLAYVACTRAIARRTGESMRTVDRALWQYSKARQLREADVAVALPRLPRRLVACALQGWNRVPSPHRSASAMLGRIGLDFAAVFHPQSWSTAKDPLLRGSQT